MIRCHLWDRLSVRSPRLVKSRLTLRPHDGVQLIATQGESITRLYFRQRKVRVGNGGVDLSVLRKLWLQGVAARDVNKQFPKVVVISSVGK